MKNPNPWNSQHAIFSLNIWKGKESYLTELFDQLSVDDFDPGVNQAIYLTLKELYEKGVKIDQAVVLKELYKKIPMDVITYLASLDVEPSNYQYWIDDVKKQSKIKELKKTLHIVADMIRDDKDPDNIIAYMEENITAKLPSGDSRIISPKKQAEINVQRMKERLANPKEITGISTGFDRLDRIISGINPGDLVVIAAQTGRGKSALALNIARHVGIKNKLTTVYLNTEMSEEQVSDRLCAMLTGIDYYNIRVGALDATQQDKVLSAYEKIGEGRLYITDAFYDLDLSKTLSIARKFKVQQDLKLLILDYIGRLDIGWDKRYPNEYQVLEQAAKKMKGLAQQLKIGVIMLAQLNEEEELAGSKRIENECDIYLRLLEVKNNDKEVYDYPQGFEPDHWLHVRKNRSGVSNIKIGLNFVKNKMILGEVPWQPN